MPVLGLICCQVLEMEFAHLLANDPSVAHVVALNTGFSGGFSTTFHHLRGEPPEVVSDLLNCGADTPEQLTVVVNVLEVGLHTVLKALQKGVVEAALDMAPYVDLLLLGYGLCGNALAHVSELLTSIDTPVLLPMDEDHPIDDCIGLLIGGRENYYAEQCKCGGTMFMTAGWANHWKAIMHKLYGGRFSPALAKRVMANYERVLCLSTTVAADLEFAEGVREFSELFGLRTEVRDGTLRILESTWQDAKTKVYGRSGR